MFSLRHGRAEYFKRVAGERPYARNVLHVWFQIYILNTK